MSEFLQFAKALLNLWVAFVTGSVWVAVLFVLSVLSVPIPAWVNLLLVGCGLVTASYLAWSGQRRQLLAALSQLTPTLEICTIPEVQADRHRVRVRNLSGRTIRFGAKLVSVTPAIGYPLPVALQLTHHPPYVEADIPAYDTSLVEVFLNEQVGIRIEGRPGVVEVIRLLLMGHPPGAVTVPKQRYEIQICAYPVAPLGGLSATRSFYIIPQHDGTIIFSDAGVPYREPIGPRLP